MAKRRPGLIESNAKARELAALVDSLPRHRRDALMAELERDEGETYEPDVTFSVTLSQRRDGYWYATCSYAGKSFSAYVGKKRDEERATTLLQGKVRKWLTEREQTGP